MFAFQAEMTMTGPARNDNRLRFDWFPIDREHKWARLQIRRLDRAELDPCAETLRLLLHPHHQLVTIDPFWKSRVIFNNARRGQQTSRQRAGQHKRREICPR